MRYLRAASQMAQDFIPVLDRGSQTNGTFTRNDVIFDRDRNLYLCPGGKELPLACERRDNGILIYRVRGHAAFLDRVRSGLDSA